MRFILTSVCCVFLSGVSVFAQETQAPAEPELNLGEPVGPRVGQPYDRAEFGDWTVRCIKAPEGSEDTCNLYQLLVTEEGAAVAEFSIFPLADSGQAVAGATIVAPLETLLTENLLIAVDAQNARVYPFDFCNSAGCVARVGFTQAEIDDFKRGISAIVRIVPAAARDQQVVLDVSLLGFTAGFDSLSPQ